MHELVYIVLLLIFYYFFIITFIISGCYMNALKLHKSTSHIACSHDSCRYKKLRIQQSGNVIAVNFMTHDYQPVLSDDFT